jgi:hypothetical protein
VLWNDLTTEASNAWNVVGPATCLSHKDEAAQRLAAVVSLVTQFEELKLMPSLERGVGGAINVIILGGTCACPLVAGGERGGTPKRTPFSPVN